MSSFPADGAMEAICFFEPRNGSVFPYGAIAERLSSLPVFRSHTSFRRLEPRWMAFNSPSPHKKIDDAGDRSASDVVRRVGWEVSLAIAPGRPSWAATTHRAVRVHRPYAFGLPSLRAMGAARMRKSINDRHMLAMPSHAMAEAELVDASILVSNLRLIRLLPVGVRGRQHDECHIGMTAKEDGEDDRQQQSCSERHWFSVVRVASTGYERHMISCRGASAVQRTRWRESIHESV
jgi:hypothetical protein